jgi:hypothetical protein
LVATGGHLRADERRLSDLQSSLVDQLAEYGFLSFPVETIGISRDTYHPTREGFDLGFVTSASDAIRLNWGYSRLRASTTRITWAC